MCYYTTSKYVIDSKNVFLLIKQGRTKESVKQANGVLEFRELIPEGKIFGGVLSSKLEEERQHLTNDLIQLTKTFIYMQDNTPIDGEVRK